MRVLSDVYEDYLRLVLEISEKQGYAKPKDLSTALEVSPASVSQMVRRLSDEGLVEYESHGTIALTDAGRSVAMKVRMKYSFFLLLLESAGVEGKTARKEAHFLEHNLSDDTLAKLTYLHERLMHKR